MNMYKRNFVFALMLALPASLSLSSCTHSAAVTESVDLQVKAEPEVPTGTPGSTASRKVISESQSISPRQKTELLTIHEKMAREVAAIRNEMVKMQVLLFRKVLDPEAEEAEIKNIRSRLLGLDRKRTTRILSALDEAQNVIGVNELKMDRPNTKQPLIDALEPWKMM